MRTGPMMTEAGRGLALRGTLFLVVAHDNVLGNVEHAGYFEDGLIVPHEIGPIWPLFIWGDVVGGFGTRPNRPEDADKFHPFHFFAPFI